MRCLVWHGRDLMFHVKQFLTITWCSFREAARVSALRGTLAAGGLWVLVVDLLPVRPGETNWSRWLDVRGMLDSIALISALALTATVPQPVDQWPLTSNQCGPSCW